MTTALILAGAFILAYPAGAMAGQLWSHRRCHRVCGWWGIGHSLYCPRRDP